MAIPDILYGRSRNRIAFVRHPPPPDAVNVFTDRGYECYLLKDSELSKPGSLDLTDSVIILQQPDKPSHFKNDLDRFSNLLNYDCRLYVRYTPDLASYELVLDTLNQLKLPPSGLDKSAINRLSNDWFDPSAPLLAPFVHIVTVNDSWHTIANLISANPAARPPNFDTKIIDSQHKELPLTTEQALLLKRAFADCSLIQLFPKTDGMSGVDAFEAFAYRATNVVGGPAPYRCFVKIGPRLKVAREFDKYRASALENVPFHLGPRLRLERCMLGKSQGVLVCDYVVGAETLRDCVRDGRGVHVIGNLFNQTLIAWRRAAQVEQRSLQQSLIEHLRERNGIPPHRTELVKKYGATNTLEELKDRITQSLVAGPVLVGTIHGDLHATNVLARMNDAVIIDLERISAGQPLLLDAASLEAGLFIDGFVGDKRPALEVLNSLLPFYTLDAFSADDHYCDPSNRSSWFVESVRQIRMQARQMERQPLQYAWTLAAALLKKACNPENLGRAEDETTAALNREDVRAMAFVLAEAIILKLPCIESQKS